MAPAVDPATLMLWRPYMDTDELLKIEQDGKTQTVAFVVGANFRKWPSDAMPVKYDVDYRLSGGGLSAPVTIRRIPILPTRREFKKLEVPPQIAISSRVQTRMRGNASAAWTSSGRVKRSPTFQPTSA